MAYNGLSAPEHDRTGFRRNLLVILVLIMHVTLGITQRPPAGFGRGGSGNARQQQSQPTGPDSTIYKYILTDDIQTRHDIKDTLADIAFLQRHGLVSSDNYWVFTGNYGSASFPLIFRPQPTMGFNPGYHQYQLYQIRPENFRFYEQNRPITDLYFSQLGSQENITAAAAFSRNFKNNLSFSLNYKRISQKGFYSAQETKFTGLGAGLRFKNKKQTYQAFLVFTNNANEENVNGGIRNPELPIPQFKRTVPVVLNEAGIRQQERDISFTQYYVFSKNNDKSRALYARHVLGWNPAYYKYTDNNTSTGSDSAFYRNLLVESRGMRRYTRMDHFYTGISLQGERSNGLSGKVSLVIDHFNISNNPFRLSRTDATAGLDAAVPLIGSLTMQTKLRLGLLQNIGNFMAEGALMTNLSKAVELQGMVKIFRTEARYNETSLVINEIPVIDTSLSKPYGTAYGATIRIPKLKFSAGIHQSILDNAIYFSSDGMPEQYNGAFLVTHLFASQRLQFWKIHFDNAVHYQVQNTPLYPIPDLFTSHQLYYSGKWFDKAMDVSLGIDSRLIQAYKGPAYQPVFGTVSTSETTLPFYPAFNVFFTAKVSTFRAMFVFENAGQFLQNNVDFDIVNYPAFSPTLRFGVQWLLKD